jgi:hypothetical protein
MADDDPRQRKARLGAAKSKLHVPADEWLPVDVQSRFETPRAIDMTRVQLQARARAAVFWELSGSRPRPLVTKLILARAAPDFLGRARRQ